MSPLVSFYAIPAVRFLQRALLHVIRTLFYVLIIFRDFKTQKDLNNAYADTSIPWSEKLPQWYDSAIEICWLVLELSLWLDRQDQKVKRVRKVALQARFDGELVFDLL